MAEHAESRESYLVLNRASWDECAPIHFESPDYDVEKFLKDTSFLSEVVRFDLPRLGSLENLDVLHLQCHIGTDTLSLARLGAKSVTGIDFSSKSLDKARELAQKTEQSIEYLESDVYNAIEAVGGRMFDLVYTGIGALCWLPSISKWAAMVSGLLKPGGQLFIREGHPVLWSLDDTDREKLVISMSYFEKPEPEVCENESTYVSTDAILKNKTTHQWNHGLGEIVTALLKEGMSIELLEEHDSIPWCALPGQMELVDDLDGEYRLKEKAWRLPASYTLKARKR
jgi:SAM-dependent methyltransferase